jgi:hypothetical protein
VSGYRCITGLKALLGDVGEYFPEGRELGPDYVDSAQPVLVQVDFKIPFRVGSLLCGFKRRTEYGENCLYLSKCTRLSESGNSAISVTEKGGGRSRSRLRGKADPLGDLQYQITQIPDHYGIVAELELR